MIKLIPLENQPEKTECLWKYMSSQKFLSFLMNKQFHYSRLDQLEDAYEGINQRYLSTLLFHEGNKTDALIDTNQPYYEKFFFKKPLAKMEREFLDKQKLCYILCWITGNRESAGMWNLYSEPGGVALKTDYSSFIQMLKEGNYNFEKNDSISSMEYGLVDYKNFVDPHEVASRAFKVKKTAFRKDKSFEHEREFRICLNVQKSLGEEYRGIKQQFSSFQTLPVEIVLHPKSSPWQIENVRKLVETFAPDFKIKYSELKLR